MAKEGKKCPVCGAKLKKMDGRMTCKDCGYYVRGAQEADMPYTDGQYGTGQGAFSYDTDHAHEARPTKIRDAKSTRRKIAIACIAAAVAVVITGTLIMAVLETNSVRTPEETAQADEERASSRRRKKEKEEESRENASGEASEEYAGEIEQIGRRPQSGFFRQLVEVIWGQPCDELSAEEYESLTAIEIARYDGEIYYQLDGGETQSLYFSGSTSMDMGDLGCFPGLEYIYLDDDSLRPGDLDGLLNLRSLFCENTVEELVDIVPYPDGITELGVKDTAFATTLDGIEKFPNLANLKVDYRNLEQLDALAALPGLRGLQIEDGDKIVNFGVLAQLTQMEILAIESDGLKDLSFVSYMPNLYKLGVEDSKVRNIDALADCPDLETVSFVDNDEIADYSVLSGMESMYDLTLVVSYDALMPDLSGMPYLKYLALGNVRDLSFLQDAAGLEYLEMEYCGGGENLEYLTGLDCLTQLSIHDFAGLTDSLEPLTRLPSLAVLDLSDTNVFGNVEEIFAIPTLYALSLTDCQVGIDFDRIAVSDSLEYLYLDRIRVLSDPTYNNGVTVEWSQHLDAFRNFPAMRELYLEGIGIDSIAFVEYMPDLELLDITDNYVTDLTPLEGLPRFRKVWCAKNSIIKNVSEGSGIEVDMDTYD